MLFFKEIKNEKLSNQDFKSFYDIECHLCSATLEIIQQLENQPDPTLILKKLNIPEQDYNRLKSGDRCDPEQTLKLASYFKINELGKVKNCPRLKKE